MDPLHLKYDVDGDDFTSAGEASADIKRVLRRLGFDSEIIRRCSICMYEGEINMVIHANGGKVDAIINPDSIEIILSDTGPGIENIEAAMTEGFSTASHAVRELGFGAGMGLPNMKNYADEINVESEVGKGTTVTMKITV
ncbi:MAG: ATP-binding protein [Oscillospiraceae bacterium]|jgi:anti-sigma regulatory factor (Ser/Thr protein kinase)|nr:ATP-binding protein [Oscillospiraceae bacterium]